MIYNSPDGDGYVKRLKTTTKYHVQFFGPTVERAWVNDANLIPYDSSCKLGSQLARFRRVCFSHSYPYVVSLAAWLQI